MKKLKRPDRNPPINKQWLHSKFVIHRFSPEGTPADAFEFDAIVVASGKKVCMEGGFNRRSLDAKLSIAVTANFVNGGSREEAQVRERELSNGEEVPVDRCPVGVSSSISAGVSPVTLLYQPGAILTYLIFVFLGQPDQRHQPPVPPGLLQGHEV